MQANKPLSLVTNFHY